MLIAILLIASEGVTELPFLRHNIMRGSKRATMDEQQIINQLNNLKQTKPSNNWVNLTKKEIFEEKSAAEQPTISLISNLFTPLKKPAVALASLGFVALILSGAMLYSPQLVEIGKPLPRMVTPQPTSNPQLAGALERLRGSLKEINNSLKNLEQAEDPQQALAMTAVIEATAKQGQKTVEALATTTRGPDSETLAALGQGFDQTAERAQNLGSGIIESLINELEKKKQYLTEEDQARLEKARDAYQQGNYTQAFLLLQPLYK